MQSVDFLNLQHIFYLIYQFLTGGADFSYLKEIIITYWGLVTQISLLVSLVLLVAIVYLTFKLKSVKKEDEKKFGVVLAPGEKEGYEIKNQRWIKVLDHLESESQADWKAAILEADIILDEMMIKMGHHGDNLGERLMGVEKSDFLTLDQAWEAHKVRNMIAHEGSDYALSKRETKRVIDLYRQVFQEFQFI